MLYDPDNKVVKLCTQGMTLEGGADEAAIALFMEAWTIAETDFEKLTAAHYVARLQKGAGEKLQWDIAALHHALRITDKEITATYPSLYLNIAKCYEDLADPENARQNYELALSYTPALPDDGYGNMIKAGIQNGIDRLNRRGR